VKHLQKARKKNELVTPVLGLYMSGLKLQAVIADFISSKDTHTVKIWVGKPAASLNDGLMNTILLLQRFLSTIN
jgi:hypothetical protein